MNILRPEVKIYLRKKKKVLKFLVFNTTRNNLKKFNTFHILSVESTTLPQSTFANKCFILISMMLQGYILN